MSDAIRLRIAEGATIAAVRCEGWLVNVNTPAELRRADRLVREETE
jgi:glucose-1-phosphate thymidylyltransferase